MSHGNYLKRTSLRIARMQTFPFSCDSFICISYKGFHFQGFPLLTDTHTHARPCTHGVLTLERVSSERCWSLSLPRLPSCARAALIGNASLHATMCKSSRAATHCWQRVLLLQLQLWQQQRARTRARAGATAWLYTLMQFSVKLQPGVYFTRLLSASFLRHTASAQCSAAADWHRQLCFT